MTIVKISKNALRSACNRIYFKYNTILQEFLEVSSIVIYKTHIQSKIILFSY